MIGATQAEFAAILRTDFSAFSEKCFNWLNPGDTYVDNWHLKVLCHALSQATAQTGLRIIILLPPRFMKSTIASVALPAYILGRDPTRRLICVSYSQDLANKFSNDTRSIVSSDWFQVVFPDTQISALKDSQSLFETTAHGSRMATSVGGAITGFGADTLIIDDPMKAQDATSETVRKTVKDWFDHTASTRLNDPKTGNIILLMQRIHQDDLAGHLMEKGGWQIIKMPVRAEEDQVFELDKGVQHYRKAGELLHPDRFGLAEFDKYRKELGTSAFYAQYQQAPVPPGGNLFDWAWFKTYEKAPEFSDLVLSVDVAATENGGNYSAFTLWGHRDDNWYLVAVHRIRYELPKVKESILALDKRYRPDLVVIDGTGIGLALFQELRRQQFSHLVSCRSRGKIVTAAMAAPMIEAGRVFVTASMPGLNDFRDEIVAFPNGKYCDQVDSMVQVLGYERNVLNNARAHRRHERKHIKSKPTLSVTVSRIGPWGWNKKTYA